MSNPADPSDDAVRTLCVVVHDVAPSTWPACRRLLAALADLGSFPVTLLAVPRYHGDGRDAAFEHWLRQRAEHGDEIALHGYTHLDDREPNGWIDRMRRRHYTRGEGEFSDLPFDEASLRLDAGVDWLRQAGLEASGFVAPAWLLGDAAWRALRRRRDFAYTCTLRHIHLLPEARSVVCQSQVYSTSAAWRRGMSVLWNESLARLQRRRPLVRMELHPADVDHARVRRSWQRLAAEQLRTRRVRTLAALAAELRGGERPRTAPAPTSP